MKLTAYLLAFGDEIEEREIEIPQEELDRVVQAMTADPKLDSIEKIERGARDAKLHFAFMYGQNDFQPQPIRSLSVGDVVKLQDGSLHRVRALGWEHLPPDTDITKLERGRAVADLDWSRTEEVHGGK